MCGEQCRGARDLVLFSLPQKCTEMCYADEWDPEPCSLFVWVGRGGSPRGLFGFLLEWLIPEIPASSLPCGQGPQPSWAAAGC